MHQLLLLKLVKVTFGGTFAKEFATPQVIMGQFGQIFDPHQKLQNVCKFRQDCLKERLKNAATERTSFLRER